MRNSFLLFVRKEQMNWHEKEKKFIERAEKLIDELGQKLRETRRSLRDCGTSFGEGFLESSLSCVKDLLRSDKRNENPAFIWGSFILCLSFCACCDRIKTRD